MPANSTMRCRQAAGGFDLDCEADLSSTILFIDDVIQAAGAVASGSLSVTFAASAQISRSASAVRCGAFLGDLAAERE